MCVCVYSSSIDSPSSCVCLSPVCPQRGSSSSLSPSSDSGLPAGLSLSLKPSSALWSSLSQSRARAAAAAEGTGGGHHWGSSRSSEVRGGGSRASSQQQGQHTTPHLSSSALPHAQVARSELNVRLPRGTLHSYYIRLPRRIGPLIGIDVHTNILILLFGS